jgi:replicative DNA helicase
MRFKDEYSALSFCSLAITMTARANNASSIILSQLIKNTDRKDPGKRPTIGELKGTGSIENDATGVILSHIPSKYKPSDTELKNRSEAIIAKSRYGTNGIVNLEFIGKYGQMIDHGRLLDTGEDN